MNHSKTIYVFDHFSEEEANGSCPKEDLLELWKRIVFSMAISNTDDHLRNHAFCSKTTAGDFHRCTM